MDLRERRETYSGFGEALARAFELAVTPVVMGGGGWLLDRWLGTSPAFTIVLFVLAVVGLGASSYYRYEADMKAHEARMPWARRP